MSITSERCRKECQSSICTEAHLGVLNLKMYKLTTQIFWKIVTDISSAQLQKLEFGPALAVGRHDSKVRKLHVKNAYL
jgi:hypothetical protein